MTAPIAEHWHVANGTPGYLFDSEPPLPTFDNARDAIAYAIGEARDERDARNDAARWQYDRPSAEMIDQLGRAAYSYVRVPLARAERTSIVGTLPRVRDAVAAGAFSVAIDRTHEAGSYNLPYVWEGWRCTEPAECETVGAE